MFNFYYICNLLFGTVFFIVDSKLERYQDVFSPTQVQKSVVIP